jgi:hypothetical protein
LTAATFAEGNGPQLPSPWLESATALIALPAYVRPAYFAAICNLDADGSPLLPFGQELLRLYQTLRC